MVGFIGALSSSLCILILVFIALLLSYIDSMMPERSVFRVSESTFRFPIKDYYLTDNVKPEIEKLFNELKAMDNFSSTSASVGCSYGFDMDKMVANNIMVYNAIKLNSFNFNIDVNMLPEPIYNDSELNYCFINFSQGDK